MTRKYSPLVPQNHIAAKFLSHPALLAILTWLVVFIIGNIMVEEVLAMLDHTANDQTAHEIFKQEQTISVMLVGLGVLLEGRQLLLKWLFDEHALAPHEAKNLACEYYGFLIMSVGLIIEIIDRFLEFVIDNEELLLCIEFGINYPLNIYAMYLLVMIGVKLLLPRKAEDTL